MTATQLQPKTWIQTERLLLRDFVEEDWTAVRQFLSDPQVTQYMHFAQYDETKLQEWLHACIYHNQLAQRSTYNRAIVLLATNEDIGWIGIGGSSERKGIGVRDFGYALSQAHWGQGYMTEALRGLLDFEFEQLGNQRIYAYCEVENVASARVMEKAGMTFEGTFDNSDSDGNFRKRHRYAIHRQEWLAKKENHHA